MRHCKKNYIFFPEEHHENVSPGPAEALDVPAQECCAVLGPLALIQGHRINQKRYPYTPTDSKNTPRHHATLTQIQMTPLNYAAYRKIDHKR